MTKTILHVEDEKIIRNMFRRLMPLSNPDYAILSAENLESALEHMKNSNIDAYVSDGNFPRSASDGPSKEIWRELYKAVRQTSKNAPFILFTANAYSQGELNEFAADSRFLFVQKPYDVHDLEKHISEMLK